MFSSRAEAFTYPVGLPSGSVNLFSVILSPTTRFQFDTVTPFGNFAENDTMLAESGPTAFCAWFTSAL
ncbi:hypothetical protein D3C81_1908660 [compost metagenome]